MWVFFGDDSKQNNPSRQGVGRPLFGAAAFGVDGDRLSALEGRLEEFCIEYGFPPGEEFKWSPGRECWMRTDLVDERRRDFFLDVIEGAATLDGKAAVVVRDATKRSFTRIADPEYDTFARLLESLARSLYGLNQTDLLIADRPSDHKRERNYLLHMREAVASLRRAGEQPPIAINVVTADSDLVRCLQFADLVASCALARVSGEDRYSPEIFDSIRSMLVTVDGVIGGTGLCIGPGRSYSNLYHWLVGDTAYRRGSLQTALPITGWPYAASETEP